MQPLQRVAFHPFLFWPESSQFFYAPRCCRNTLFFRFCTRARFQGISISSWPGFEVKFDLFYRIFLWVVFLLWPKAVQALLPSLVHGVQFRSTLLSVSRGFFVVEAQAWCTFFKCIVTPSLICWLLDCGRFASIFFKPYSSSNRPTNGGKESVNARLYDKLQWFTTKNPDSEHIFREIIATLAALLKCAHSHGRGSLGLKSGLNIGLFWWKIDWPCELCDFV